MCRTVSVTVVIWWSLRLVVNSYAQEILIQPYKQPNLLLEKDSLLQVYSIAPENLEKDSLLKMHLITLENLEKDTLLQMHSIAPENKFIKQIQIGIEYDNILLEIIKRHNAIVNREVFNNLYNQPKVDEKKRIREAWKKVFGFDVWYPYYKAKDVEKWVKKKFTVKVFKLKGEPKFEKNKILYTFAAKF